MQKLQLPAGRRTSPHLTDGLGDADGNGSTGEGIGDGLATGDGLGTGSGGVVLPVTVKLYRPRLP